jgi:selenocysteine-specific elongation factor
VPTSAVTRTGLDELKAELAGVCAKLAPVTAADSLRESGQQSPSERATHLAPFRLPIDRSFVVQGHGTVVTGSVVGGGVKVGDELDWHKGDGTVETVRVRSMTNHGKPADELHRGQRGGLNLAGVPHDAVRRGQELATPGYLAPSKVLTVRLHTLAAHRKAIKHRLPCRLHVGTAEVMVTVSLLDADQIEPGQWGLAQLFLEAPVTVVWGQPFVLRDSSAEHTIGGGQVLQPCAVKLRRRHLEHLERVEQLWDEDAAKRAVAVAWFAGFSGFQASDLTRDAGISPEQMEGVVGGLLSGHTVAELTLPPNRKLLVHMDRVTELGERVLGVTAALHAEFPLMTNHERSRAIARLDYIGDEPLLNAVIDRLVKEKKLVGDARRIARADFKPKLSAAQRKLKDKIVDDHKKAAFQPPEASSYLSQVSHNATTLRDIFEVACAEGFLVRVTDEIYLHADADADMRNKVTAKLADTPAGLTVADIRDLLGTTRKYAVPLCEFLDKTGLTKRNGDFRVKA